MEVDRQNLAEAVTLAERKYSEEKKKVDELQQQVKLHRSSLESAKQELVDYKQKATRILQVSMSAHSDVPLYGRRQPSTHWGMCWLHCPAAHWTLMKGRNSQSYHCLLGKILISDDAVVAKQLCCAPVVVPIKTVVTSVALNISSERKHVLPFIFRLVCLSAWSLSACFNLSCFFVFVCLCLLLLCLSSWKHVVVTSGRMKTRLDPSQRRKNKLFFCVCFVLLCCSPSSLNCLSPVFVSIANVSECLGLSCLHLLSTCSLCSII